MTVAAVPWARHDARHTRAFDDQVAWLVTHTSKSAVMALMRIAWRTVGAIAGRVVADGRATHDPFDGLVRIGIDEISYRRGHQYLMVVLDHDTGRLVWAAAGHDRATLQTFFDLLGPERASQIKLISADAAEWIGDCALAACENASLCRSFHIVGWAATRSTSFAAGSGRAPQARTSRPGQALEGVPSALWKNPEDLTDRQRSKLAWIARHNQRLYRAYLLKEQLRLVFQPRVPKPSRCWTTGWPRRVGRRSPRTSSSTTRSRSTAPGSSRRSPRPVERADREREHHVPVAHPDRLRVQVDRQPDRPVPPGPRRLPPTTTRPAGHHMTQGNSRRA